MIRYGKQGMRLRMERVGVSIALTRRATERTVAVDTVDRTPQSAVSRGEVIALARRGMAPVTKNIRVVDAGVPRVVRVKRQGVGPIITPFGEFWVQIYLVNDSWHEYIAIFKGAVDKDFNPKFVNPRRILLRIDSGCKTGHLMDLTCDCREQLHRSMEMISQAGEGLIIHIPMQEGRGKGLPFKLATLLLQSQCGMDTVEAAGSRA